MGCVQNIREDRNESSNTMLEIEPSCSIPLNCIYLLWSTGPSPQYFLKSKDRIRKWVGEAGAGGGGGGASLCSVDLGEPPV